MHISDFFSTDLRQECIALSKILTLLQLGCAFLATSSGISFEQKKSLLRVDFLPKGPCNIDYFPSIQDVTMPQELTGGRYKKLACDSVA